MAAYQNIGDRPGSLLVGWPSGYIGGPLPIISRVYDSYNPGYPSVRPFLSISRGRKTPFYNDRRVRQSLKKHVPLMTFY